MPVLKTALGSVRWKVGVTAVLSLAMVFALGGFFPASAEHTRFWRQSDYESFESGTANGTAVRSDGKIMLAPKFAPLADTGLAYLWDLKLDSRGNLYAAGGSNAKVVKVDPAGKMTTVFDSAELSAQALAIDRRDNVYVATSPDGKIYKLTPDGQKSVFFDPQTKYIWALTLGADGTLYVATGEDGKIFAVAPNGKGEMFYTSSETHVRALALDNKGNLLAGTEPNGLVLRIPLAAPAPVRGAAAAPSTTDRQAYVLYETPRREITSLLMDSSGNLYVGAIGDKPTPAQGAPATQTQLQTAITTTAPRGPGAQQQPQANLFRPFPVVNSSAVYRIAADGSPEELWSSRQNIVYSLEADSKGQLLLGTGNQGTIIELDQNRVFSQLTKSTTGQVTGLARGANGKIFVATANPGKLFTLGPELETDGTFESEPFDAGIFSQWGRLTWWGQNASTLSDQIDLYVRAGNTSDPQNNWSPWFGPYRNSSGQEVQAPAARFVQWKAVLRGDRGVAPEISWVDLAYLPKNEPPRIEAIAMQGSGVRVAAPIMGLQSQTIVQLRQPTVAAPSTATSTQQATPTPALAQRREPMPQGIKQKGQQAVLWSADDANDDDLIYSIYYRGESEKDWKLLQDKVTQQFYSWDTTSMPDGAYYLKIVVSDERSNASGAALTGERESDRFVVDNTPPSIMDIAAAPLTPASASGVTVRFRVTDATSAVVTTQYSIDADEWVLILPTGGLGDSLDESYTFTLRDLAPGEHTVAVRAYDQYDNVGAGKVTFTIPAARR